MNPAGSRINQASDRVDRTLTGQSAVSPGRDVSIDQVGVCINRVAVQTAY